MAARPNLSGVIPDSLERMAPTNPNDQEIHLNVRARALREPSFFADIPRAVDSPDSKGEPTPQDLVRCFLFEIEVKLASGTRYYHPRTGEPLKTAKEVARCL